MAPDRPDPDQPQHEQHQQPTVRQLLHAVTGDRDAEAKALADQSDDDVSEDEAKVAVRRAAGDIHAENRPEHDVARPEDAKAVREERSDAGP